MTVAAEPKRATGNGKRMSEIDAEMREWADEQPAKSSCAISGCRWKFSGTAREARVAAADHRASEHPELRPRTIQQIVSAQKKEEKEQMAERSRQAVASKVASRTARTSPAPIHPSNRRWTTEKALDGVRRLAAELGHPPSATDAKQDPRIPSGPTVVKLFGSHADMIEQAGFDRPTRSTRYGSGSVSPGVEDAPVAQADPEPEAPEQPGGAAPPSESPPLPDELVAFVYLLLRDHLSAGTIEDLVLDVRAIANTGAKLPTAALEAYARDVAARLLRSAA